MVNLGSTQSSKNNKGLPLSGTKIRFFSRLAGVRERTPCSSAFLFFLLFLILSGMPQVIQTISASAHIKPSFYHPHPPQLSSLHSYLFDLLLQMDYFLRPLWSFLISLRNLLFPTIFAIKATPNLNFSHLVSLDSPAAAKQAGDNEKAPTFFIMPDLVGDCPFPLGRHPNADALTAESTAWLVGGCPELSPKRKQALWGLQVRNSTSDFPLRYRDSA